MDSGTHIRHAHGKPDGLARPSRAGEGEGAAALGGEQRARVGRPRPEGLHVEGVHLGLVCAAVGGVVGAWCRQWRVPTVS